MATIYISAAIRVFYRYKFALQDQNCGIFQLPMSQIHRICQDHLFLKIIALDHQWDTTMVDNPKVRAQTLSQFNTLFHISIGKSSIANLLQICRLNKHFKNCYNQINGLTFRIFMVPRSNGEEMGSYSSRLRGLFSCMQI